MNQQEFETPQNQMGNDQMQIQVKENVKPMQNTEQVHPNPVQQQQQMQFQQPYQLQVQTLNIEQQQQPPMMFIQQNIPSSNPAMDALAPVMYEYQSRCQCWKIISIIFLFLSVIGIANFFYDRIPEGIQSVVSIFVESLLLKATWTGYDSIVQKQYNLLQEAKKWMQYAIYGFGFQILVSVGVLIYYIVEVSKKANDFNISGLIGNIVGIMILAFLIYYFNNINVQNEKIENSMKQQGILKQDGTLNDNNQNNQ